MDYYNFLKNGYFYDRYGKLFIIKYRCNFFYYRIFIQKLYVVFIIYGFVILVMKLCCWYVIFNFLI